MSEAALANPNGVSLEEEIAADHEAMAEIQRQLEAVPGDVPDPAPPAVLGAPPAFEAALGIGPEAPAADAAPPTHLYDFEEASRIVRGLTLKHPGKCIYIPPNENEQPKTTLRKLPFKPYDNRPGKLNTIVDLVEVEKGSFNMLEVRGFTQSNMYMNLPGVLAPKQACIYNYDMELLFVDKPGHPGVYNVPPGALKSLRPSRP